MLSAERCSHEVQVSTYRVLPKQGEASESDALSCLQLTYFLHFYLVLPYLLFYQHLYTPGQKGRSLFSSLILEKFLGQAQCDEMPLLASGCLQPTFQAMPYSRAWGQGEESDTASKTAQTVTSNGKCSSWVARDARADCTQQWQVDRHHHGC